MPSNTGNTIFTSALLRHQYPQSLSFLFLFHLGLPESKIADNDELKLFIQPKQFRNIYSGSRGPARAKSDSDVHPSIFPPQNAARSFCRGKLTEYSFAWADE
jgi:hypothetical protein